MKFLRSFVFVLLVAAMLLAACAPAATPAPAQPPAGNEPPALVEEPTAEPTVVQQPPTPMPTTDPNAVVMGGKVIIGTSQEPNVLSPLLASATIDDVIGALVVEGLVGVDAEGNYVPVLAEELPTLSEDGLVVTYKIKPT